MELYDDVSPHLTSPVDESDTRETEEVHGDDGNLFDRFYYTAVPDFIDLNYKGFHWFIFNIADIFITIGIIYLIMIDVFKKRTNEILK